MRIIALLLCAFVGLQADFLENIYVELRELNLSKDQHSRIKHIVKEHHSFLKRWYADAKKNDEAIMESFFASSLGAKSPLMERGLSLVMARFEAQQEFLMRVYEILNTKQRVRLGEKIKERRIYNNLFEDFHESEAIPKDEIKEFSGEVKMYDFGGKIRDTKRVFLQRQE